MDNDVGGTAVYTCVDENEAMLGDDTIECSSDRTWTTPTFICTGLQTYTLVNPDVSKWILNHTCLLTDRRYLLKYRNNNNYESWFTNCILQIIVFLLYNLIM